MIIFIFLLLRTINCQFWDDTNIGWEYEELSLTDTVRGYEEGEAYGWGLSFEYPYFVAGSIKKSGGRGASYLFKWNTTSLKMEFQYEFFDSARKECGLYSALSDTTFVQACNNNVLLWHKDDINGWGKKETIKNLPYYPKIATTKNGTVVGTIDSTNSILIYHKNLTTYEFSLTQNISGSFSNLGMQGDDILATLLDTANPVQYLIYNHSSNLYEIQPSIGPIMSFPRSISMKKNFAIICDSQRVCRVYSKLSGSWVFHEYIETITREIPNQFGFSSDISEDGLQAIVGDDRTGVNDYGFFYGDVTVFTRPNVLSEFDGERLGIPTCNTSCRVGNSVSLTNSEIGLYMVGSGDFNLGRTWSFKTVAPTTVSTSSSNSVSTSSSTSSSNISVNSSTSLSSSSSSNSVSTSISTSSSSSSSSNISANTSISNPTTVSTALSNSNPTTVSTSLSSSTSNISANTSSSNPTIVSTALSSSSSKGVLPSFSVSSSNFKPTSSTVEHSTSSSGDTKFNYTANFNVQTSQSTKSYTQILTYNSKISSYPITNLSIDINQGTIVKIGNLKTTNDPNTIVLDSYQQAENSTVIFNVKTLSNFDRIIITNIINITGGTLVLEIEETYQPILGDTFILFQVTSNQTDFKNFDKTIFSSDTNRDKICGLDLEGNWINKRYAVTVKFNRNNPCVENDSKMLSFYYILFCNFFVILICHF